MIWIDYPSLKQQLADRLFAAVLPVADSLSSIPLQTDSRSPLGTFVSPIALQLAGQPPAELAQDIVTAVPETQGLKLWVKPPGWIYGRFCEDAIATHLQQLITESPRLSFPCQAPLDDSLSDPLLFPAQYAHARCCSLLYLAQREGLIELQFCEQGFPTIANSIPGYIEQKQFRCPHPAEQTLIRHLLEFPGALQTPKRAWRNERRSGVPLPWPLDHQHLVRYTQQWGETFLTFYRDCRIFGEVSQQNLPLSQTRLGFAAITQKVLAFLLQDLLHLIAPKAL